MNARRILVMTLAGLAGLLLAVGITTAATELTSQRIGLQEEPLTAGEELVPTATTPAIPTATTETAPPPPSPTTTATQPESEDEDDGSGRGRGRGRGRGGEDDD